VVSAEATPISSRRAACRQAADAADDDGDEARHEQVVAHVGLSPSMPGGQHAGEPAR
jgi:hypothetical protein